MLLEPFGDAEGRAAGGKHVVEEGDIEGVTLYLTSRNVRKAEINLVFAVFFGDVHPDEVTLPEGEFALLPHRDDVDDVVALREHRSGKKEAAGFGSGNVG